MSPDLIQKDPKLSSLKSAGALLRQVCSKTHLDLLLFYLRLT